MVHFELLLITLEMCEKELVSMTLEKWKATEKY